MKVNKIFYTYIYYAKLNLFLKKINIKKQNKIFHEEEIRSGTE